MTHYTHQSHHKRDYLTNGAIIFTILLQSFTIVWWASSLSTRVDVLETWVRDNRSLPAMLNRMEERFDHLKSSVERLVRILEGKGGPK